MNLYELFDLLRSMKIKFESLTDSQGRNLLHYSFEQKATGLINSLSNNHEILSALMQQKENATSDFTLHEKFNTPSLFGNSTLYPKTISQKNECFVRNNEIKYNIAEQLSHLTTSKDSYLLGKMDINDFISKVDNLGFLHQAARDGDLNQVVYLVEEAGADVNLKANGSPALHYALQNNHFEIAKILVERYGAIFINPEEATLYSKLLGLDIHIDLEKFTESKGNTLLHIAVIQDNVKLVTQLMTQHKINIQAVNKDNKTAFDLAIDKNNTFTVKAILDLVDSSIVQIGDRKINHQIPHVDLPVTRGHRNSLILIDALKHGYSVGDFENLARKYFINVNQKDSHGRTVLHAAIFYGEEYVTTLLHKLNVDPTIADNYQNNPLDLLVNTLSPHTSTGAQSDNPYPRFGESPLFYFRPNLTIGLELLKSGIKPRMSNRLLSLSGDWRDLMTLGCHASPATIGYDFLERKLGTICDPDQTSERINAYSEFFLHSFKQSVRSAILFSKKEMLIQKNTYASCSSSSSSSNEELNISDIPLEILRVISDHHVRDISLDSILSTYPLEVILQKWKEATIRVDQKLGMLNPPSAYYPPFGGVELYMSSSSSLYGQTDFLLSASSVELDVAYTVDKDSADDDVVDPQSRKREPENKDGSDDEGSSPKKKHRT